MPADYELLSVTPKADTWSKDFGQGEQHFQGYELLLKGPGAPGHEVKLNRKLKDGAVPEDKVPQVGQTLYLQLDGKKAKQVQKDEGSSNGSGGDEYSRRPDHPENVARMRHTAAMSAAPAYYELLRTEGVIPKAESKAEMVETLQGLIRWIEDGYPMPEDPAALPSQPEPPQQEAAPTEAQLDSEIPF